MDWTRADRLLARTVKAGLAWNILLLAVSLCRSAGALAFPALLAAAIDERLMGEGHAALVSLTVLMAALLLGEVANQLIAPWCVSTIVLGLRRQFLDHALRLTVRDRAGFASGDLTSRLLTSTTETGSVVPLLTVWTTSLVVSGGALVALGLIDPRLLLAFVAGGPAATLVIRAFVGRISPLLTAYLGIQGRISGRLVEVLTGIRTVRAAGTEHQEIERVLSDLPDLHSAGRDSWKLQGKLNLRASLLMPLMQVTVIATAGFVLVDGAITPGQLTAAAAYVGMALGLFGQANLFMALAQARAGARRVDEVLSAGETGHGDRALPAGTGELSIEHVTVTGPEGPLLDGVDLRVPGGSTLAVVGTSGSGKSTLAAVAGRLIDPDEGRVLLDGVPLRDLSPPALAAAVGWAFERPVYLTGTFAEAIGFGGTGIPHDRVRRAARAAQVDPFIRRLPLGYDTPCSDALLSGGERQRLGLARGLAHGGRVLILDDALSSVDSITELRISKAIAGMSGVTRILVTHKISIAGRADRVAWIDRGRIRACAPHAELWRMPDYRRLFQPGPEDHHSEGRELSHV
ncbi:ABC transporter ATP-binding protein [Nonomuraea harbinensis]|uniref:ABC transporter ATP-binding protein n=1 Tax=Nonomuraea harbinensis TaxID=1286938 RepID=A0ABW1BS65_9ACTN|nr:ABC transporter ATP-binding protein [Nonomuraea harbinensis]